MIKGMKHCPYKERLQYLWLFCLEKKVTKPQICQIRHGIEKADGRKCFSCHSTRTRGLASETDWQEI